MDRVTVALMSAARSLGVLLVIAGLGMMLSAPAFADDDPLMGDLMGGTGGGGGGGEELVPFFCSSCMQQSDGRCARATGCFCPATKSCFSVIGSNSMCSCQ